MKKWFKEEIGILVGIENLCKVIVIIFIDKGEYGRINSGRWVDKLSLKFYAWKNGLKKKLEF